MNCANCGKETGSYKRGTCSIECFVARRGEERARVLTAHNAARKANAKGLFICEQCGEQSYRQAGGSNVKRGSKNRFCSHSCQKAFTIAKRNRQNRPQSKVYFPHCKGCGIVFTARRTNHFYCSARCDKLARKLLAKRPALVRQCECCGSEFNTWRSRQRMCSKPCARAMARRHYKSKYNLSGREWASLRLRVLRRDSFSCYVCGVLTDPDADPNADNYPNADHVVPLARKGRTSFENLRCACRACNMMKASTERGRLLAGRETGAGG